MNEPRWSDYWPLPEPWSLRPQAGGINNDTRFVQTPAGPHFLRIYRPDAHPVKVAFELAVLQALQAEPLSFGVPAPVPTRSGPPLARFADADGAERMAILVPLLPGTAPDWGPAETRSAYARAFGLVAGELTAAMGRIRPAVPEGVLTRYGDMHLVSAAFADPAAAPFAVALAPEQQERLHRLMTEMLAWIPGAYATLPIQPIHGDLVPFNLLFAGDRFSAVLDFELATFDLRSVDLATALAACGSALWGTGEEWAPMEAFVRAYVQHQAITPEEAAAVPNAIRLRRAVSFLHMAGRHKLGLAPDWVLQHGVESALSMEEWMEANAGRLADRLLTWTSQ